MPLGMQEAISKYGYNGKGNHHLNDSVYYCTDDSRFMNHSETPSLTWIPDREIYVASYDMIAGTELTCDYSDFCEKNDLCFSF